MEGATSDIGRAIEASRRELLDLGLRNPLLNYRPSRSRGLQVVDELSAEVFRILVSEGRPMTFGATPESDGEDDEDGEPFEVYAMGQPDDEPGEPAARHLDMQLQSSLTSARLQSALVKTGRAARTFVEEQGVNTLFLALGALRWYEDENSSTERSAPLLLVPVQLERASVQERFHLVYSGDEIVENLSLAEKLRLEFDLALPNLPTTEDLSVNEYLAAIREAVVRESRWRVEDDAISLDFFSFGKFLMYRDLDPERWPEGESLSGHPLIRSLLSREPELQSAPSIQDDDHLDAHLTPPDVRHVVDADSSQSLALLDVKSGRNLLIQGPPGTGKSQTITNLIAEAVSEGKTVLFVSEKMAALEVVKRRLDSVGIGDACLELHSRKTKKARVLQELGRTLTLGKPQLHVTEGDIDTLEELRDRLNAYCEAVNREIGESGVTPYEAFGELVQQGEGGRTALRTDYSEMDAWSLSDFRRRQLLVERLQSRVSEGVAPGNSAFRGTALTVMLPTERDGIKTFISSAFDSIVSVRSLSSELSGFFDMAAPDTVEECEKVLDAARTIQDVPDTTGVNVGADEWIKQQATIEDFVSSGLKCSTLRRKYSDVLIPEAWDQDLLATRQVYASHENRLKRLLSRQYRAERDRLRGLCREKLPETHEEQLALLDAVLEFRRATALEEYQELGEKLFGDLAASKEWRGTVEDWQQLSEVVVWVSKFRSDVRRGAIPEEILAFLDGEGASGAGERVVALCDRLEEALKTRANSVETVSGQLALKGGASMLDDLKLEAQENVFRGWFERFDELREMVAFNQIASELQEQDLSSVVRVAETWEGAGSGLVNAYRYTFYEGLATKALKEHSVLAGFDRSSHERIVERFRELDRTNIRHNQARIALEHWKGVPKHEAGGQLAVLTRELNKKRRHLPIRQLMKRAGKAVQAIKPVFMMSPLSVANYIEPGSVEFDLVVFDEASQVRPVEALGAIARGKQTVVVGDDRQLPPTRFFDALMEDEVEDETSMTSDLESVLGLFKAQNMPSRMLRWHYRSRHESLIAVSNHEFYENRLTLFPSPDRSGEDLGLRYHHLPDTVYDRGGTRSNPGEAKAVAEKVMRHAKEKARLTLGVAAFSSAQAQAIEDHVELLRRKDPSCEGFFTAHPFEPFFVKSLENVQGDERDVMFVSLGYGRDANGNLAMAFGPLNQDGGERRLNVLITRSRRRCEVFTNLLPDDIDLSRTSARGVRSLKTFLTYAKSGNLDVPTATGRLPDSPFEEAVLDELQKLGYRVDTQVGSAGFFVDLAVVDSDKPGRYVLGIECDGATYHSARSARDRDRLRQEVLEGLGWQIHRIWSTDWFSNPESEIRRTVEAIERARLYTEPIGDSQGAPESQPSAPVVRVDDDAEEKSTLPRYEVCDLGVDKYYFGGLELHEVSRGTLADWVVEVATVETPVHLDDVTKRITDVAGVNRAGRRIRAAVDAGCGRAERESRIVRRGDFIWLPDMTAAPLRDRSELPDSSKKAERIAPEELEEAIVKVVSESYGMQRYEIPPAVLRLLLGFRRATKKASGMVSTVVDGMVDSGRLSEDGGHVTTGGVQNQGVG